MPTWRSLILLLTTASLSAGPGLATGALGAATSPAPKGAIAAARTAARHALPGDGRVRVTGSLRSRRRPSWSLVTGSRSRHGLWAAWVRRRPAGRYVVEIFRTRSFDPGPSPPCDIRPAFSEPAC